MITWMNDTQQKQQITKEVLEQLPEYFGIPEANKQYIKDSAELEMGVWFDNKTPRGFIIPKPTSEHAVSIHLVAVIGRYHRQGIGKALIEAVVSWAKNRNYSYLTVKTLAETHPDEGYKKTRLFYQSQRFYPIEVFPTLWDEANPCLLMIRYLN